MQYSDLKYFRRALCSYSHSQTLTHLDPHTITPTHRHSHTFRPSHIHTETPSHIQTLTQSHVHTQTHVHTHHTHCNRIDVRRSTNRYTMRRDSVVVPTTPLLQLVYSLHVDKRMSQDHSRRYVLCPGIPRRRLDAVSN